jgi:hypothetical protein
MFKEFIPYWMLPPNRLRFFGALLSKLGFAMTILGFFLQAGLKAMAVFQTMTKATLGNMGVENILPGLPTWFIPETAVGFTFWIMVTALGFYCMYLAGEIKRIYSWNT